MKSFKKKLARIIAATTVISSIGAYSVFAASYVSGTINGHGVNGSLSMGTSSATASTTLVGANATSIQATVKYHYGFGQNSYTSSNGNGSTGSYVSTTANASYTPVTSYGAKGTHFVSYGAYTWSQTTSTGQSF